MRSSLYGVLVSLVAGALLGAAPALQASRVEPSIALGETSRGGTGSKRRRRLRAGFIVAETAGALALLAAAGILTDTFDTIVRENGSLVVDGLLTLELTADEHRFPSDPEVVDLLSRSRAPTRATCRASRASAAISSLPRIRDNPRTQFTIDGRRRRRPAKRPGPGGRRSPPDYFTTLGVPMVAGRAFAGSDRADAAPVVVSTRASRGSTSKTRIPIGRR